MKFHGSASAYALVLALLATSVPAAASGIAIHPPPRTTTLAQELRARCDPRLEALRAGRVGETARLTDDERAALRSAQDRTADHLLDLRAGGAVEILLIVVLVLLILALI